MNIYLFSIHLFLSCNHPPSQYHMFYLHGRILEDQGRNAYSEQYGKYEYDAILDSLSGENVVIHSEIRPAGTDVMEYATKISSQIDSLINIGIPREKITIIGASKGAIIAMTVSSINYSPVNYVLLGGNNDGIEQQNDWDLHGRVLGIYEVSDSIAGKSYNYWFQNSRDLLNYKELELNTGMGHGFLYHPIHEWIQPSKAWIYYQKSTH